jgi:hypothetical protein
MSGEMGKHGWGFCGSEVHLPEQLFRRIVGCYISVVYYAGVAMVGQRFSKELDVINVDAWKLAFDEADLTEALGHFYCDALPLNYQDIIHEEIDRHALKGLAPAKIPLSTKGAKVQWNSHAEKFGELEKEVNTWVQANLDKLPNALVNFDGTYLDEETDDDYNEEQD